MSMYCRTGLLKIVSPGEFSTGSMCELCNCRLQLCNIYFLQEAELCVNDRTIAHIKNQGIITNKLKYRFFE